MLLADALAKASSAFASAGIETPEIDAQLLAAHVLGSSRGSIQSDLIIGRELTARELQEFEELAEQRAQRMPLQHLTAKGYFRNLELKVGKGVFIPRPETESVAELAIQALRAVPGEPIAVDLCTGSGAIAISMATEVPNAKVYAWELNPDSEIFLRDNIAAYGNSVRLTMGDIADDESFKDLVGKVSVVISNPPYIPVGAIPRDVEVREHDPALALYGGEDGMDVMRVVSRRAMELLVPGGFLVVEHADNQAGVVADLLIGDGWKQVRSHKDLSGRDRAVSAVKSF
jgi:release factor glutamine methyltransferase